MTKLTDLWIGAGVLLIAALLYATGLPQADTMGMSIAMDPGWYPWLLLVLAMLCGLGLIVSALVRRGVGSDIASGVRPGRMVAAMLAISLYVAGFWTFGYWVATLLFIPALSWGLGHRKPVEVALVTVVVTSLVWLVFTQLLLIPLRDWPF
ncbi:tripartite tricarboxylate transporter TctB family protein [Marinobacterium rhizophilum]|uniref:Tripartite tricarboxylate transporter TctB family protein n=1 Tax=Marinobacterium rhizophilum TaxID=420402 RepID=A0ABY5HNW6_9GAMM|nr:tripartite tricarboxylate transporter TctB family protein [Marinobacterium rhizophilum]UTW12591.1 tripartite tricarboxylate transporter TctB family protein [Marinobacterium rhizophilum]